jgi:membrane associated rhomboid family serine protease
MKPRAGIATLSLAAVTAAVSLAVMVAGLDVDAAARAGFIPARFGGFEVAGAIPAWLTPFSATLLHGGMLHLVVNLVMLVFVGLQVERVLGARETLFVYVVGAVAAALAQWGWDPSGTNPMIGASGAISGLFGTYALLFGGPKRVTGKRGLDRSIHAAWLLVAWVAIQWMSAQLAGEEGLMLATPAHIGGFIAGLLLERPMLLWKYRKA